MVKLYNKALMEETTLYNSASRAYYVSAGQKRSKRLKLILAVFQSLIFKIVIFIDFQALDSIFVTALEPKGLKLEGLFFGIWHSIYILKGCYVEPLPKRSHNSDLRGEGVFTSPPCWIILPKYCATKKPTRLSCFNVKTNCFILRKNYFS